jgi:hypothetical protein
MPHFRLNTSHVHRLQTDLTHLNLCRKCTILRLITIHGFKPTSVTVIFPEQAAYSQPLAETPPLIPLTDFNQGQGYVVILWILPAESGYIPNNGLKNFIWM